MKDRKGKKSSPLDGIHPERWTSEFTDELLRVLWILEETLRVRPRLDRLLERVCAGPLLMASALPRVPAHLLKPPRAGDEGVLFSGNDAEETDTDE
jgi:hypothetical protein